MLKLDAIVTESQWAGSFVDGKPRIRIKVKDALGIDCTLTIVNPAELKPGDKVILHVEF